MRSFKEQAIKFKPGVPKRYLLMVATSVWLFAGGFLLLRGIRSMPEGMWAVWKTLVSVAGGLAFFRILFLRISSKHILRITTLEILRPCVFSFFDFKSYLMMALMITMGITVRKFHLIAPQGISYFFITMSVPLLISALRFAIAWIKYLDITKDGKLEHR